MAADNLAMQGARSSAVMVLTSFAQNIMASEAENLRHKQSNCQTSSLCK